MSSYLRKKRPKRKTGFIDLILVFVIFLGVFLSGNFLSSLLNNPSPNINKRYVIISPTIQPPLDTLQFQMLKYKEYPLASLTPPTITQPPGSSGKDLRSSYSTCNGKYDLNNPIAHPNFGDPICNFTKNDLYKRLLTIDPANASFWFSTVIPCESSYNPNAIQPPGVAVDPAGAWGLYQMGRGKNGQYDHGDVPWQIQTDTAVQYNNILFSHGVGWHYWLCASTRWQ